MPTDLKALLGPEKPRKEAGNGPAEAGRRETAAETGEAYSQLLHRIFTERCRTASKRSRACSVRCSSRRATIIAECVEKINEDYFYIPAHQTIYTVLVDLWNAGQGIDLITFTQVLRDRNLLETVGGAAFITSLFTFVPDGGERRPTTSRSFATNTSSARSLPPAPKAPGDPYEEQDEVDNLLDEVEQKIFAVGEDRFKGQMLDHERPGDGGDRGDRETLRAQRRDHRILDRLHRARSDDERPARSRDDRDRRAPEHGQDRALR